MIDNRRSLWDVHIQKVHIGNKTYVLEGAPDKGASCFVYHAKKIVEIGEETYEHRVLLKEFYPLLNEDHTAGMIRGEDGSVIVPEKTKDSEDYKYALKRFQEAYGLMLELGKTEAGAETTSVPLDYMEAGGTYYIEEAFDSGRTFEELFGDRDSGFRGREQFFAEEFFPVYLKCIKTVSNLHKLGYLHLDFNPKNISYTYAGNVKLFDTDTFVKKEELDKVSVWRGTKGFAAREIISAAKSPRDARVLIGEWTDVYALTQLFCWFLYGHPLEEREIDEALEQLESQMRIMDDNFQFLPHRLSKSGVYRLKVFLRKNLNRDGRRRAQSTEEMLMEAEELQKVLFYKDRQDEGVPVDNFRESKSVISGHGREVAQLYESLAGKGTDKWGPTNVAILVGTHKEEREQVARYYATMNRLKYSDIVEIHCDDFSYLIEEITNNGPPVNALSEFRSRGDLPILFIIYDEQEKDFIRTREICALNEMMDINRCQVLIVAKHNRCLSRKDELSKYMRCTTVALEADDSDLMQEDGPVWKNATFIKSLKKMVLSLIVGMGLIAAGFFLVMKADALVGPMMYEDTGVGTTVYSIHVMFNEGVWAHILGVLLITLGAGIDVHSIFDFKTPYGWKYFIRQFRLPIVGFTAAVFAYTMPAYFAYACRIAAGWEGFGMFQSALSYVVEVVGFLLLILWTYQAMHYQKKRKTYTDFVGMASIVVSFVCIVAQTITSWAEWILISICLAIIYIGIGAVRE